MSRSSLPSSPLSPPPRPPPEFFSTALELFHPHPNLKKSEFSTPEQCSSSSCVCLSSLLDCPNSSILYFWGHRENSSDASHRYLFSNFYPVDFEDSEGRQWASSEQYFMYRKSILFPGNEALSLSIRAENDPGRVKGFGRSVENFDDSLWEISRFPIMCEALWYKFVNQPKYRNYLIQSKPFYLVESSPTDAIWGIGIDRKDGEDGKTWNGENLLGKALMHVRYWLEKTMEEKQKKKEETAEGKIPQNQQSRKTKSQQREE